LGGGTYCTVVRTYEIRFSGGGGGGGKNDWQQWPMLLLMVHDDE